MLPFVLSLSFASGAAALIYELVWFQLLELIIGSTTISLCILLATFMGGLCAGSLILPRAVSRKRPPLHVYAVLEFGIGASGCLILLAIPAVSGAVAVACLLVPTLLMGATLPALARIADARGLGLIYGANTMGAVFGCLFAGFYLLRVHDVAVATYVAAGINVLCGATACLPKPAHLVESPNAMADPRYERVTLVYVSIALSGFSALAAETVWTRALGLLFGPSVYTLSIVLAAFLMGLGIGSTGGSILLRTLPRPREALAWCQILLAAAIAWTAYTLASLPLWPIDPAISTDIRFTFQLDLARALWALLPPTLLWGASFPFALAAAGALDNGGRMSTIYAANTLGAIPGAIVASLFLVPQLGTRHAQQVLIALPVTAGLLLLVTSLRLRAAGALAVAGAVLLIVEIPPITNLLIAHGRYAATWVGKGDVVYAGEGVNASVAVSRFPSGALTFHVSGKIQASNVPRDMRLQRMLGHLTTITAASPRSVLVIGCGAGITAGAVSIDPRVERETIVEIEPLVPLAAAAYFSEPNFGVLHNPKVQLRIADGRHYLLASNERFDGITIDPLDPWVKGAANLYTEEFFRTMKRHLHPGGVVTMYIQLFETTDAAVKSSLATFFQVFPNGTIWGNTYQGKGHDMVLMGQAEPLRIDLDEMEQRYRPLAESLSEVGINSPEELFANYAGRGSDLAGWLQGAAINRDRNLRMQYLAGVGLNRDDAALIYAELLKYSRFPEDSFSGTEGRVNSLRELVRREQTAAVSP